jgi:hypothetical protein
VSSFGVVPAGAKPNRVGLIVVSRSMFGAIVCGGVVGKGDTVCLVGLDVDQGEDTCGTSAHKTKTQKLDDVAESTTVLLIRAPGAGTRAYLSPVVPTDRVTVTKELLEETRTVASWQAWAHNAMEGAIKSEADLKNLAARFDDTAVTYAVTPRAKKKGRYEDDGSPEEGWTRVGLSLDPIQLDLTPTDRADSTALPFRVLDEWKKLAKNQAAIVSATEKTQVGLAKLSKSTGADIDSLEIKSARANFLVGTRPEDFGTTSVWTVLEKLESELSREQERIAATKAELENLTMSMSGMAQEAAEASIKKNVMGGEIFEAIQAGYRFTTKHSSPGHQNPGDMLEERLQALEKGTGIHQGGAFSLGLAPTPVPVIPQDVVGLDARLKALETDVLKVRAEAMSTRVEVAGVEFVSPISVEEWVAQNQVVQGPMMFLDVVSLLQLAYAAGQGDQQATLAYERSASQVGYRSSMEATIATSFGCVLPSIFTGKAVENISLLQRKVDLPGLAKFEVWDTGSASTGIRSDMRNKVKAVETGFNGFIKQSGLSYEAKGVAHSMLTASVLFVDQLSNFMSMFYTELTGSEMQTDDAEAWTLTCSVVKKMFDDIAALRTVAKYTNSKDHTPAKVASIFLWATLNAHRIMDEYLDERFRHHRSIAPIINFHLYQFRVPWSAFDKKVTAVQEEATKAFRLATEAKRVADRSGNGGGGRAGGAGRGGAGRGGQADGHYDSVTGVWIPG